MNNTDFDKIIQNNLNMFSNKLNTGIFEDWYTFLKDLIFDNLILFIILYLFILPYTFRNNNFNYWMVLIIPLVIGVNYLLKIIYRRYTNIGNSMRANTCLERGTHIIVNKTIRPIETKKELLDRPLHEFLISSSHNTYVPCTQNVDIASTESIKRALAMGARVIELDCYAKNNIGDVNNPDDMTPIVAHGVPRGKERDILTTSYVTFEECIDTIATYGFLTSDPLIVCLEVNTNRLEPVQKKMREIVQTKLKDHLLGPEYKYSENMPPNRKSAVNEPIRNLLNKVIFIAQYGLTDELMPIIDLNFKESNLENMSHTSQRIDSPNNPGTLGRVYPDGNIYGHLSYNFDPVKAWKNKFQIVALNFQVVDDNLMKNFALFKNNSFVHFSEI